MNMKKLFLLNLPYLLFVYPFDKLAQAFRLAPGADLSGNGAFQRARLLRGAAGECSLYRCRTAYDREYEKRKKRGNYI